MNNNNYSFDYKEVFALKTIYCKTCDTLLEMKNAITICLDIQEVIKRAENEHNKALEPKMMVSVGTSSLCSKPLLVISYDKCLLAKELYKELINIK